MTSMTQKINNIHGMIKPGTHVHIHTHVPPREAPRLRRNEWRHGTRALAICLTLFICFLYIVFFNQRSRSFYFAEYEIVTAVY